MRVLVGIMVGVMMAGPGAAAPVPLPPDDFAALQYIDGAGCVFERDGDDWAARLDKSGAPICGFPPTFSTRRRDPDADRVLPLGQAEAEPTPEEMLVGALASGLRAGEFTSDPRPAEPRGPALEPSGKSSLGTELDTIIALEPAVRAQMAGAEPVARGLCARLGYVPDPEGRPHLGEDVTLGLCAGMRSTTLAARLQDGLRQGKGEPAVQAPAASAIPPPVARKDRPAGNRTAAKAPARPAAGASVVTRRPVKPVPKAEVVEIIPASARYVQIGGYTDDENASHAIRRLSDLGYRVAQSYGRQSDERVRIILAGPFKDRQALIEALNRLRGSGYPRAMAR